MRFWSGWLCVVLGVALAPSPSAASPNILFVLFDDLGYGEPTSFRTESVFRTPAIDRLAREGLRFTDAHSAASVCTPTRYGVLTGRYPCRIGQFGVLTTYSPPIIPPTRLTVAGMLKQQGYRTACIGKWHLGLNWDGKPGDEKSVPVGTPFQNGPLALGFDEFWGFTHARNIGTMLHQDRVAESLDAVEVQPFLAEKTCAFLDAQRDARQPFFLYLPLCSPHTPIVPAPEFVGQGGVSGAADDKAYGDWLQQGDWVLGQVLERLDRHRLTDNTLIIVASDNGAAGRSYAPLRASKSSIYEGGHRIPCVARWPGVTPAGATCDVTVCLNDLIATCAEIVGISLPPDAGEDSVSLLPLLKGGTTAVRESTLHQAPNGDLALRQGEWKLVRAKDGTLSLYNLRDDLSERSDVFTDHQDVGQRLRQRLDEVIANGRSTPGPAQANDAPATPGRTKKRKVNARPSESEAVR